MTNLRSAKAKGRQFQKLVAETIRNTLGLSPEHVVSTPASVTGEDIILSETARKLFPFSVECKNQEHLNIWKAIDQAEENNPDPAKYASMVVFSKNRRGVYIAIPLTVFLDWLKGLLWLTNKIK